MFRDKITNKNSFTLVEIILVVFILSIVYIVTISSANNKSSKIDKKISLMNLKTKLLKYDFKEKIEIICIQDGEICYVFIDGKKSDEKIEDLFSMKPAVYSYDTELNQISFDDLELEKLDTYEVCFSYKIDKYLKSDDVIVQVDEKVYIFNSINKKPIIIEYLSDVSDYFNDKQQELKDAF